MFLEELTATSNLVGYAEIVVVGVNEVIMEDAAEFLNLSEDKIAKIALKEAEDVAKAAVGLAQIAIDGDDIYWVESRPNDSNRNDY